MQGILLQDPAPRIALPHGPVQGEGVAGQLIIEQRELARDLELEIDALPEPAPSEGAFA